MSDRSLEVRVTNLENLARTLEPLPQEVRALRHEMGDVTTRLTAVESQVVQLRGEMRDGFSAIREEIAVQGQELRAEMTAQGQELRAEMTAQGQKLRAEMNAQGQGLRGEIAAVKTELKQDISALGMEMAGLFLATEHKTLMLFEEFLGKRRTIDEGHRGE